MAAWFDEIEMREQLLTLVIQTLFKFSEAYLSLLVNFKNQLFYGRERKEKKINPFMDQSVLHSTTTSLTTSVY